MQYVTEDFNTYIARKRLDQTHGNHVEIHAMSELYNRPIEVYCYDIGKLNSIGYRFFKNSHLLFASRTNKYIQYSKYIGKFKRSYQIIISKR